MISKATTRKQTELPSQIQIRNKQRRYKIDRVSAAAFCSAVLQEIEKTDYALSVVFLNNREMREINKRHLQRDYPTDVLSFAFDNPIVDGLPFLGEVAIAPEVAAQNAKTYRIHPDREIKKLLLHGILHLAGYNHEIDDGRMRRLQSKMMRRNFFQKSSDVLKS